MNSCFWHKSCTSKTAMNISKKYWTLLFLSIILLNSCTKFNKGVYEPESMPYSLSPIEKYQYKEPKTSYVINCYYCFDSSLGYDIRNVTAFFNKFLLPDDIMCRSVLSCPYYDEVSFSSSRYPGIEYVHPLPALFDLNKNGYKEIPYILYYQDSIVFCLYDVKPEPQNRWLIWQSFPRPDWQYVEPIAFWRVQYSNKLFFVFRISNRVRGRVNVVDTIVCYNMTDKRIQYKKPLGINFRSMQKLEQVGLNIIGYSNDVQNNVKYNGFDDYHTYVAGVNLDGNMVWADTLSGPERSDLVDDIISFDLNDSVVAVTKAKITGPGSYEKWLIFMDKNSGKQLKKIKFPYKFQLRGIERGKNGEWYFLMCKDTKLFLYNDNMIIAGVLDIKENFEPIFSNNIGGKEGAKTSSLFSNHGGDINKNSLNEILLFTAAKQVLIIDGQTLEPLAATPPIDGFQGACFYINPEKKLHFMVMANNSVTEYDIAETPLLTRILVYKIEIIIILSIFVLLPLAWFLFKKFHYFRELFSQLSSKSDSQGIIIFSSHGKVRYKNPKASELLSLQNDSLSKINDFPVEMTELFKNCVAQGTEGTRELVLIDGTTRHLLANIKKFKSIGSLGFYLFILNDVTQIAEEQKRRDMLSTALMITHNVKTSLATAQLQFDELVGTISNSENIDLSMVEDSKSIISGSISEAGDIIRRISYIAKDINQSNLAPKSINQVILDWLDNYSLRYIRRGIEFKLELMADSLDVMINPKSFDLLIQTICDNSIEAMPYKQKEKIIRLATDQSNGKTYFSVSDNGTGMSEEVLNNVKKSPGFSSKRTGTGLGMQLVFKVVKEHNIEMEIESEPGKGTTFKFIFDKLQENI